MMDLDIPQPISAYIYYDTPSSTYGHNQRRCDDINLDKKLGTHSWDWRVNMIIFGIYVVNT